MKQKCPTERLKTEKMQYYETDQRTKRMDRQRDTVSVKEREKYKERVRDEKTQSMSLEINQ